MPQTFSLLLMKSLHEENTAAAVKRVYDMRDALNVLNLEDEQSASIKVWRALECPGIDESHLASRFRQGLMLGCFINPAFLSCTEGRRFCSFLFGMQCVVNKF